MTRETTRQESPLVERAVQREPSWGGSREGALFYSLFVTRETSRHESPLAVSCCIMCAAWECMRQLVCVGAHARAREELLTLRQRLLVQRSRMGWLRFVGSVKLQVSFSECGLFYRALLQKRLIILRSLLIVATPYIEYRDLPLRIFADSFIRLFYKRDL